MPRNRVHDCLEYLRHDPVHRKHHHNELTFRTLYAFTENFVLPLSHDEVVHGKGSLLDKMPGDEWQKRATCGCCSAGSGQVRARSCCSWAARSASGVSGFTTGRSTGSSSTMPHTGASIGGYRT